MRAAFDVASARGVGQAPGIVALLEPFVAPAGTLLVYAPRSSVDTEEGGRVEEWRRVEALASALAPVALQVWRR
jgi:hypothetical protein